MGVSVFPNLDSIEAVDSQLFAFNREIVRNTGVNIKKEVDNC